MNCSGLRGQAKRWMLIALAMALAAVSTYHAPQPAVQASASAIARDSAGVLGLMVEPDDGRRALLRAIRKANRSVWLTMYLLTDHTIIHDLEYAHASGADVRVILEPHPYGAGDNANLYAYNNLMAADIPVHWSTPRFRLTHEKGMIVDDTAYIMTTNFTHAAFHGNREFDVIDRDPRDVAAVRTLFAADWDGRSYLPRAANLPISPSDARSLLSALIGSAHRTLDVYGEELQDTGMAHALAAAARRGVRVRLILPAVAAPDPNAPYIATVGAAGVTVHRLPQSYLYIHAKAIVVDGRRAFVGSENLSTASLDQNRELGIILSDADAISRIEATFSGDWVH